MNYQDKNWWFIFFQNKVLIQEEASKFTLPTCFPSFLIGQSNEKVHHFKSTNGVNCSAVAINTIHEEQLPPTYELIDLRDSYFKLPLSLYKAAGMAYQLLYWDKNTKFCPVCGNRTEQVTAIMKKCSKCGKEQYPTINTAIIVLITKGDEILLARGHKLRGNFYGLIAGFLEVGETLEECVHREVMEETNIIIKNLRYFGNQTWPYPSGLMIGFIAEYDSGEIKIQEEELKSAAFYHKDNLPNLPQKLSLARKMIDAWLNKE